MFQQQQTKKIVNFMEISWLFVVVVVVGIERQNGTAQKATKIKSKKKLYIVYAI